MDNTNQSLPNYIDSLQAKGNYFLLKSSVIQNLNMTPAAFKNSVTRLIKKKRLIRLKNGFYLIVPLEYRNIGAPPPEWFIDQLMKAYGVKYYMGLLTAASLHGASHQQPQIYQIITDKVLRPLKIGRVRIHFYFKKSFENLPLVKIKTPTGYTLVSSPELTAFDLVSYLKQSGHINHVSTIFTELGEKIDPMKLCEAATHFQPTCIQRTGYILDYVGFKNKTQSLLKLVSPRYYPLRSDKKGNFLNKNQDWHIYVNEQLEPDL
jgi:predicted transcriptional regulator of viral defense system